MSRSPGPSVSVNDPLVCLLQKAVLRWPEHQQSLQHVLQQQPGQTDQGRAGNMQADAPLATWTSNHLQQLVKLRSQAAECVIRRRGRDLMDPSVPAEIDRWHTQVCAEQTGRETEKPGGSLLKGWGGNHVQLNALKMKEWGTLGGTHWLLVK